MEQPYTAFISYPHASPDQEVVKRLHTAIETYLTIITEKPLDELITLHTDDYSGVNVVCTPDRSRILVSNRAGETGVVVLDGEGRVVTPIYGMPGTMAESWAVSDDGKLAACLSGFGFSADGRYAVGVTEEGADCYELWTDEEALIRFAKAFAAK